VEQLQSEKEKDDQEKNKELMNKYKNILDRIKFKACNGDVPTTLKSFQNARIEQFDQDVLKFHQLREKIKQRPQANFSVKNTTVKNSTIGSTSDSSAPKVMVKFNVGGSPANLKHLSNSRGFKIESAFPESQRKN